MSDMLAAWIGEEAIAIEYRLDRGRAPCRVAFPEDFVKVANQKILDAIRHFSMLSDMRCSPLSPLRTAPGHHRRRTLSRDRSSSYSLPS